MEADLPPCGGAVRALLRPGLLSDSLLYLLFVHVTLMDSTRLCSLLPWRTSYLLGLLLHGIHAFAPVPARYPDLWTLLITSASCGDLRCTEKSVVIWPCHRMLAFPVFHMVQLSGSLASFAAEVTSCVPSLW